MTPAPAGRNRRSAILTNIPLPQGQPPQPPLGHSPHSSVSSQTAFQSYSGPAMGAGGAGQSSSNSSFAPPRASFSSSSRASPVGHSKSVRGERDREEPWQDNAWRSIFDAALVKAQQAVQLDELQETALAANLYAQAANDLGRVIPMCTSEKKKQSMIAIQTVYLDRVTQLKEAVAKKETAQHHALVPQVLDTDINDHDGNGYRYSVSSNRASFAQEDTNQPQQYAPHLQQQRFHPQPQIYQTPSHQQLQQQQLQYQQQIQQLQLQQQQLQLQQQQLLQSPPPPPPQQESSDKGGFRLFGKKRSKTQPSSSHPPLFMHSSQDQLYDNNNNTSGFIHYNEHSTGSGNTGYVSSPYMSPQTTAASKSGMVSPIYMTNPPPQSSVQAAVQPLNDMLEALDGPIRPAPESSTSTTKSSKWRPFGKKKSKSVSAKIETNLSSPNLFISNDLNNNKSKTNLGHHTPEFDQHPQGISQAFLPPSPPPPLQHLPQHLPQPNQPGKDWFVGSKDSSEEFDNLDRYLDDEDEDVDPYYVADNKGRASAFEGKDSETKEKEKDGKKFKEEARSPTRKVLTGPPSSYSQDKTFSPTFTPVVAYSPPMAQYGQEENEERLKSLEEDEVHRQQHITNDAEQSLDYQEADQDQDYNEYQDAKEYQEDETAEPYIQEAHHVSEAHFHDAVEIVEQEPESKHQSEHQPSHGVEVHVSKEPVQESEEIKADETAVPEKTKIRRTWYGKKKKEKGEKEKDKDKEEKEKEKEKEKAQDVARLMDEALFGGPVKKASKNLQEQPSSDTKPVEPLADDDELRGYNGEANDDADADALSHHHPHPQDESTISSTRAPVTESLHDSEIQDLESASASQIILPVSEEGTETPDSVQKIEIDASAPKRSKSRHFSIFRSKKKSVEPLVEEQPQQSQQQDGGALTLTITKDDDKSIHSHTTRKSSIHGTERRAAAEMAAALAIRPKDNVKRKSDEYVPYEYQEELEGPLMERVAVPENREVIGFVLPVEEIVDYNAEGNEEAAIENWDSWVSQLESFEKVLSDKGLKKEKAKKAKKEKESKDKDQDAMSPMGSLKNNRSSIFGLGRSDTVRSRPGSTLDLNSHLLDSRPLSMSTTLLDDASFAPRQSFQSSRSGGSEAPSQMIIQPQVKKRWWKRKETPSVYRASNAYSTADLDQDHHLSSLLQSQNLVRSHEDLTLETQIMSMPIILSEPVKQASPAKEISIAEIPAVEGVAAEVVEKPKEALKETAPNETTPKETLPKENVPESEDEPVAPMPKLKAKKSIKPKLLPISTPLPQLLKIENAEELWQYVQQAKTYATGRMNKGDKRSAAIALKRAQALEARWQEILLEMASSDEDTDQILEDDEEEEATEESSEEEVVVVIQKKKNSEVKKNKRESLEIKAAAPAALTVETKVVTPTTPTPSTILPTPSPSTVSAAKMIQFEDDEDEEERNYAATRRRSISRSNSTPDKYSKYKVNKTASPPNSGAPSKSLAILNEDGSADTKTSTKPAAPVDDGRLGPDATLNQMLESTNVEHVKFYIQRMKTDTVAKARSGSKFAALEGMKNVKVLQQHLEDLQAPRPPQPAVLSTVSETIVEEDEEEEEKREEAEKRLDAVLVTKEE
ncbi:hypothetical protein BGZ52_003580 [Haplosporangium bisporale]|nr:hypothetical protein BGZ52_003580 [Haplosporangium bisporale]